MVKFTEITSKTVRANYEYDEVEGYMVVGSASYDKDDKIIDADGQIKEVDTERIIANFNTYGSGEDARINLTNCLAGKMGLAVTIAEGTLAELAASYPEA